MRKGEVAPRHLRPGQWVLGELVDENSVYNRLTPAQQREALAWLRERAKEDEARARSLLRSTA